jgi:hypothetical protein
VAMDGAVFVQGTAPTQSSDLYVSGAVRLEQHSPFISSVSRTVINVCLSSPPSLQTMLRAQFSTSAVLIRPTTILARSTAAMCARVVCVCLFPLHFVMLKATVYLENRFPVWTSGRAAGQPFTIHIAAQYASDIIRYPPDLLWPAVLSFLPLAFLDFRVPLACILCGTSLATHIPASLLAGDQVRMDPVPRCPPAAAVAC